MNGPRSHPGKTGAPAPIRRVFACALRRPLQAAEVPSMLLAMAGLLS